MCADATHTNVYFALIGLNELSQRMERYGLGLPERALPNNPDAPTTGSQFSLGSLISPSVVIDFLQPEIRPRRRSRRERATMMTMPEASLDLNHCIPSREDEVWTAR